MEQNKDQSGAVRALPSDLTEREEIDLLCQVETYMSVTDKHSQTHPEAEAEEARIYSLVNGLIAKRFSDIGAAVRGEAVAKCTLPPAGWYCTRTAGHDGPCAAYPVNSTAAEHEAEILELIDQRDKYHDMADQLAAQIAAMTEVEIGEHSSANEPWRNALIAGDEFIAVKFKAFCNGPISARAADAPSEPSEIAWRAQFWKLALALNCFPSQFIDANEHVFKAVESLKSRATDALDSQPTDSAKEEK